MAAEADIEGELISGEIVRLAEARKIAFNNGLSNRQARSVCWKIFFDYLPPEKAEWPKILADQRALYAGFREDFDPQKLEGKESSPEVDADREVFRRVGNDVMRTSSQDGFYESEDGGRPHDPVLLPMLYIYVKLNPGLGYVQGMHELASVIYHVFYYDEDELFAGHQEADTFFCFVNLMSEVRNKFNKEADGSDSGVSYEMIHLNNLLKTNDYSIWEHLEDRQVDYRFYSFRWVTLLLSMEFDFLDVIRLWDALLSDDNRFDFVYSLCCSMLIQVRDSILAEEDFGMIITLLQNYPSVVKVATIFDTAVQLRNGTYSAPDASKRLVLKEGQLYQRVSRTEWQLQWFSLVQYSDPPRLEIARCSDDPRKLHTNVIELNNHSVEDADIKSLAADEGRDLEFFPFSLMEKRKSWAQRCATYQLAANDPTEKFEWVGILRAALEEVYGERLRPRMSDAVPITSNNTGSRDSTPNSSPSPRGSPFALPRFMEKILPTNTTNTTFPFSSTTYTSASVSQSGDAPR